jgi:ketosteroid isomerase-like protein
VATNSEIVRSVTRAMEQGDPLAVFAHLARDVVWNVHAAEPDAAPWLGVFEGRRGVAKLLDALSTIGFTEAAHTGMLADGDHVVTLTHLAFDGANGTHVELDEVQVWRLVDGKVASVDVFLDTAAVAAAFA